MMMMMMMMMAAFPLLKTSGTEKGALTILILWEVHVDMTFFEDHLEKGLNMGTSRNTPNSSYYGSTPHPGCHFVANESV